MSTKLGSKALPLKELAYSVSIIGVMSNTLMTLQFQSTSQEPLEASLNIDLPVDATLHELTIITNNKTIHTKIMKTERADKAYENATVKGNIAVKAKKLKEKPNTINVLIGKIEPKESVKVEASFYRLCSIQDESWRLILPTLFSSYSKYAENTKESVKFNATISIKATSQILDVLSKTHKITSEYNSDRNEAKIVMVEEIPILVQKKERTEGSSDSEDNSGNSNSEDEVSKLYGQCLVLLYKFRDMSEVYMLQEEIRYMNEYAYCLCFTPSVALSTKNNTGNLGIGEYIFLLDNSGSMSGTSINLAKKSLELFIKSLPPASKFNFIVFNTSFKTFSEESVIYNESNVERAFKEINIISTNGGTSILEPLQHVFKSKPDPKFPRVVFLITDGAVEKSEEVVEEINKNASSCTVNSLGIGTGVDNLLISKTAKAGNGCYWIVESVKQIPNTVIQMLAQNAQLSFSNIHVEWGIEPLIHWSSLKSGTVSYMGQSIYLAGIFNKRIDSPVVSYIDTSTGEKITSKIAIEEKNKIQSEGLSKIIANNCIRHVKHNEFKNIKDIGLKYGILCDQTSLYAEIKDSQATVATSLQIEQNLEHKQIAIKHNDDIDDDDYEEAKQEQEKEGIPKLKRVMSGLNFEASDDSSSDEAIKRHTKKRNIKRKDSNSSGKDSGADLGAVRKLSNNSESGSDERNPRRVDSGINDSGSDSEKKATRRPIPKKRRDSGNSSDSNNSDDSGNFPIASKNIPKKEAKKTKNLKKSFDRNESNSSGDDINENKKDIDMPINSIPPQHIRSIRPDKPMIATHMEPNKPMMSANIDSIMPINSSHSVRSIRATCTRMEPNKPMISANIEPSTHQNVLAPMRSQIPSKPIEEEKLNSIETTCKIDSSIPVSSAILIQNTIPITSSIPTQAAEEATGEGWPNIAGMMQSNKIKLTKSRKGKDKLKCKLTDIIMSQGITGDWSVSSINSLSIFEVPIDASKIDIPAKVKGDKEAVSVWCTLIMMTLLILYYGGDKKQWILIYKKAYNYALAHGIDYNSYVRDYKIKI